MPRSPNVMPCFAAHAWLTRPSQGTRVLISVCVCVRARGARRQLAAGAQIKPAKDASGVHANCIQLTTASGAAHILAAETETELAAWTTVMEAAAAGRPASAPEGERGTGVSPTLASISSAKGSARSELPSGAGTEDRRTTHWHLCTRTDIPSLSRDMRACALSVSARSDASASVMANVKVPDVSLMVHAGWLVKKGEGLMAKSQQRWCVLYRTAEIHYFDKQWATEEALAEVLAAKGHKGAISLAGVKATDIARTKPNSPTDFSFCITTPKRKWYLTAAVLAHFDDWHKAISDTLGDSAATGRGSVYNSDI